MAKAPLPRPKAILRAQIIKSLAHPSRIQMVDALGSGEMCVRELAHIVGADMSTVSKHLALLATAGILTRQKAGQCVYYGIKDQLAMQLCELVRAQLAK